ncbi:hypothetical protein [Candidatus Leptofilum sp.]|uniref:hypothetical protein n=1 Tax=Candidatus Leptofilum sp. TaxID=3241576 RepID=UPI003B5A50FE
MHTTDTQYFVQAQNMRRKRKKFDHAKAQSRQEKENFAPLREIWIVALSRYELRNKKSKAKTS